MFLSLMEGFYMRMVRREIMAFDRSMPQSYRSPLGSSRFDITSGDAKGAEREAPIGFIGSLSTRLTGAF